LPFFQNPGGFEKMANYQIELSTGKKIVLREFKIKHKNLAAKAASKQGVDGQAFEAVIQDEILKLLIVNIDGQKVEPSKLEDLDSLFDYSEYQQLMLVIKDMLGIDVGKPKVTILSDSGDK
jgi:hypothetical protein